MAIVTRQEFADLCGKPVGIINTNVSRKKISTLKDKRIDTENPLNKIFYKKCKQEAKEELDNQRKEKREAKKAPATKPELSEFEKKLLEQNYKDVVEIFTPAETLQQKRERKKQNEDDQEITDWDRRKKIADALKAERAAELSQLQVEKMMGNLMPVDMVEQIIKVNIQDIFKNFENELINVASIYCDILAGGNREKLSEIIKKLRLKLSDIIERTKQTAAQEVENVIEDYAESRNRGERK